VGSLLQSLGIPPTQLVFVGQSPLDPSQSLGEAPIFDGCTIADEPGAPTPLDRIGQPYLLEIREPSTPPRSIPLATGETIIGRLPTCGVVLSDPTVSGTHLSITVSRGSLLVKDLASSNGTYLNDKILEAHTPTIADFGSIIEVGATRLVALIRQSEVDLERDGKGAILFNRPSRIREPVRTLVIDLPAEISEREAQFDLLSSAAPGATSLAYGSFIPVIGTGINVAMQKRRQKLSKKQLEKRKEEYRQELESINQQIASEVASQQVRWNELFPGPVDVMAMSAMPDRRMWERRSLDPDANVARLGIGTRLADIEFEHRGSRRKSEPPELSDVPVTVDLATIGVLGIAGASDVAILSAHWLIGQFSFFRPPNDLLTVVLTAADREKYWSWFPFLSNGAQERLRSPWLVGNSDDTVRSRISELSTLLDARLEVVDVNKAASFVPDVVVVLDGARTLRSTSGLIRLLKEGPKVGIRFIACDVDRARLPEECRGELIIESNHDGSLSVEGERTQHIAVDLPDQDWMATLSRRETPFRLLNPERSSGFSGALRFLEMVGIDLTSPEALLHQWRARGRSTEAWIGMTETEALVIDLQRDGPHALVAGTTGAGKSELLQTLIASLAMVNTPEALNFVLVDYKGASAFAECAALPHTVGVVTNLDGHLTERALKSLDAELHRREVVLRDLGASDLETAWRKDAVGAARGGLARLVLVIDEFAELVHELPDFVDGLIRIARVGRSLGVHLILATQRPTGVVTPEMRANTGLRIALRVQDKADSTEIVDAPNAAAISRFTPGRGFVRTGGSSQLTEFQTSRVGGAHVGRSDELPAPVARTVAWPRYGDVPDLEYATSASDAHRTDIAAFVAYVGRVSELGEYPVPRRPWLDALPDTIELTSLLPSTAPVARHDTLTIPRRTLSVPIGLADFPSRQVQEVLSYDIARGENWAIVGGPRSGKTSALLTMASSLAINLDTSDVSLYGLDFGGGGLLAMEELPHVGAVIRSSESERLEAWIVKLVDEHRRRQNLLSAAGAANIVEYREQTSTDSPLPYMGILIDRWEMINQIFPPESGSAILSELSRLIREGSTAGISFVVTGDRGLLTDRVFSHFAMRTALNLADKNDYRLIDLLPKDIADASPPGRLVRARDGVEIQLAQWPRNDGETARSSLRAVAEGLHVQPAVGQLRVDPLPDRITLLQALALPLHPLSDSDAATPVAVCGDVLARLCMDPRRTKPGFAVAGPRGSGRTTAALRMASAASDLGWRVHVFAEASLSLYHSAFDDTVDYLNYESNSSPEELSEILGHGDHVIIIDDSERFFRSPLDTALTELLGSAPNLRVIITGSVEDFVNDLRGVAALCKRSQTGIILRPASVLDGQMFGQRIERTMLGGPPGRGQLFLRGNQLRAQVIEVV
jgi:S-DNA-T family DNA segregation ATPase FtsK/SpoIIIE